MTGHGGGQVVVLVERQVPLRTSPSEQVPDESPHKIAPPCGACQALLEGVPGQEEEQRNLPQVPQVRIVGEEGQKSVDSLCGGADLHAPTPDKTLDLGPRGQRQFEFGQIPERDQRPIIVCHAAGRHKVAAPVLLVHMRTEFGELGASRRSKASRSSQH